MQSLTSPQEIAELELALERTRRVPQFRLLLLFFWGLIMAKCLFFQWLIVRYQAPINGPLFLWTPSLLMSGAVTIYLGTRLFRDLPRMPLSGRLVSATWVACGVAFVVLAVAATGYGEFSPYLLPALAAVLLGVGSYIQSVAGPRRLLKMLAAGWWLGALALFYQPQISALAWMSLLLLVLLVIPTGWLYWTARRAARAAGTA